MLDLPGRQGWGAGGGQEGWAEPVGLGQRRMATANYWHSQWLPTLGFRPGRSTHQLERGQTIRTMQELLGQSDGSLKMFDTDVLNRAPLGAANPEDLL